MTAPIQGSKKKAYGEEEGVLEKGTNKITELKNTVLGDYKWSFVAAIVLLAVCIPFLAAGAAGLPTTTAGLYDFSLIKPLLIYGGIFVSAYLILNGLDRLAEKRIKDKIEKGEKPSDSDKKFLKFTKWAKVAVTIIAPAALYILLGYSMSRAFSNPTHTINYQSIHGFHPYSFDANGHILNPDTSLIPFSRGGPDFGFTQSYDATGFNVFDRCTYLFGAALLGAIMAPWALDADKRVDELMREKNLIKEADELAKKKKKELEEEATKKQAEEADRFHDDREEGLAFRERANEIEMTDLSQPD